MAFNSTIKEINHKIAQITLSGELDRNVADDFKGKVETVAQNKELNKLVLDMTDLSYMASAGLRVLIFAKQQMGAAVTIFIVGAQEMVADTIEKTGFNHSVVMLPKYEATQIEND